MNSKTAIVLIALIGVGLYALPSTLALFAGQHSFVNIDATGNQIDCVKCHGDVKAELDVGLAGTTAPHANFECEFCHRVRAGEASGDNAYSQITYTSPSGARRMLILTERDMEARNVPVNMTGTSVSATTISGVAMGKNKVSTCYNGTTKILGGALGEPMPAVPAVIACTPENLLETFLPPAPRTFQATSLYNTDGTPKDTTDATKLGTFDASKVSYPNTCVQSTRKNTTSNGYDWTCGYTANFTGAGSEVSNSGTAYHAASLVSCLECHGGEAPTGHHDAEYGVGALGGCNACHYAGGANKGELVGIMAAGFGLGVTPQDTGTLEVHKDFVKNNDGILEYEAVPDGTESASNTACVACHTHVSVDIEYTKPTTIDISATMGADGSVVDTVAVGMETTVTYGTTP